MNQIRLRSYPPVKQVLKSLMSRISPRVGWMCAMFTQLVIVARFIKDIKLRTLFSIFLVFETLENFVKTDP